MNMNVNTKRNNGANARVGGGGSSRKFCGHCKKLGKTEREYTSHFPRASLDVNSPVTCPEILKTECTFCHEFGHWASYCPTLKLKIREDKKMERSSKIQEVLQPVVRMTTDSKFAVLGGLADSSSDDEEEVEAGGTVMDEFPVLGGGVGGGGGEGGHKGLSFIDAIKKPVVVVAVKQVIGDVGVCVPLLVDSGKRVRFDVVGGGGVHKPPSTKRLIMTKEGVPKVFRNGHYMTHWADDSSSDEEEESGVANDAW